MIIFTMALAIFIALPFIVPVSIVSIVGVLIFVGIQKLLSLIGININPVF